MSIPESTRVLVIGGGPAGSYAASALAREGIDTVVLEGDKFPRYHVGESMLPSLRHFLRFIDLDDTFVAHGFYKKIGAAFVLNNKDPAYTDFVGAGGPNGYSWNVIRSEADDLIFRHAGKSGAQIFDGVKVSAIEFAPHEGPSTADEKTQDPGRPVSATWTRKEDSTTGVIKFDYLIDASGRVGVMSTKYLKNRHFNQGLKNVASWGYWQGAGRYGVGTPEEGVPYFEALSDGSGWAWFIPLHDGTTSVGVVINQEVATRKKKEMGSSGSKAFYLEMLKAVPRILGPMLKDATLVTEIKAASDWSYSASSYASYNTRIVGDAGCFIDPFFSSGVHLAVASGLSAAATICASIKGQCSEHEALGWHSKKVAEGYTRFLLIVLSALKQIREHDQAVLSDWDEEGFERAFAHFRPIIQGTADVHGKLTQEEVSKTVDFCLKAFAPMDVAKRDAVLERVKDLKISGGAQDPKALEAYLSPEELHILNVVRAREMMRSEDTVNIDTFTSDTIDGRAVNIIHGSLGLISAEEAARKATKKSGDILGQLMGEEKKFFHSELEVPAEIVSN
ncbi:FAD/NAD(P)-binding domain-containing protein [Dothidotthia symphoricarpi CBS 119687]|uniref:FAD/NAD(P)-binding domain-containing protein n=1 Tax=Dothidotthia symphoricarpi CBS 119687 TaxID=1392245 RepID=A0A6A6AC04_9PLEO|nr:FAD/NAD(P)-binding domain-containing protein [Dothidotthia symphoricarpi CBS 119687]KAF2128241.1 FAD/NAD(P)-binding domain-containing protein [Dothidotthia symphoricarpi CBS 119687]